MRLTKKYHKKLWGRIADLEAEKARKYFYVDKFDGGFLSSSELFTLHEAIEAIFIHLNLTLKRNLEKVTTIPKKSGK